MSKVVESKLLKKVGDANLDAAIVRTLAMYSVEFSPQLILAAVALDHGLQFDQVPVTFVNIKLAISRLIRNGIIEGCSDNKFKMVRSQHTSAILSALQNGDLRFWMARQRKDNHKLIQYGIDDSDSLWLDILWFAIEDNVAQCIQKSGRYLNGYYSRLSVADFLLSDTTGRQIFETFSGQIQVVLLSHSLSKSYAKLSECQKIYEFAINNAHSYLRWPNWLMSTCRQALLRGNVEELFRLLTYLPEDDALVFRAALKLFQGEYQSSYNDYRELIKLTPSFRGSKNNSILQSEDGLFYTLAGIGENSSASLRAAQSQTLISRKLITETRPYDLLLPLINSLIDGTTLSSSTLSNPHIQFDGVEGLIELITLEWRSCNLEPKFRDSIIEMRDSAHENGYVWLAAEFDVFVSRVFDEPAAYPDWHVKNGFTPLINTYVKLESWQRSLQALSTCIAPNITQSRLAWILRLDESTYFIDAVEQKLKKNGDWSKGRIVSLKRLLNNPTEFPNVSTQDRRIISCIESPSSRYVNDWYVNPEQALPLMISHPAVYWHDAPDVAIEVVLGEAVLMLKEEQGQISINLVPNMNGNQELICERNGATRVVVYLNTPELKQISRVIRTGLKIPVHAKEQLVEAIKVVAPHITVHSDIPELATHITSIAADTTIYVHLLPLKEGLRVQFLQRPHSSGTWYAPGHGPAFVLGEFNGETVQAVRDLSDETHRINQLIESCPSFVHLERSDEDWTWEIFNPEHCLEVLSELKGLPEDRVQLVWPKGESLRIRANRSLKQMRFTIKKQGEWFEANGDITLDDGRIILLRELMQMAIASNSRFLRLKDNDYLALTENFRNRLLELHLLSEANLKGSLRINSLAAATLSEISKEVGELDVDYEWKQHVEKLETLLDYQPAIPETLQADLRDYQVVGFHWMARLAHWGVGACLADDMGLGKTLQALAIMLLRAPNGPALVVCPLTVLPNWIKEASKFAPTLNVRSYVSNRDLRELSSYDVIVVTYHLLQQDTEILSGISWHTVALDEAQAIKNAGTKRSQAAMALKADFRFIVTGTPIENHLGELWNLFRFTNPGLLGSRERFTKRYAYPIEKGDAFAKESLKKLIQPFILRRIKSQVLNELPPSTQITLQVELSEAERHMYEALRQQAVSNISSNSKSVPLQVLAEITKLRRFCCNPQLVLKDSSIPSSKLAVFAETLEEILTNNHKCLVFSQFVDHLTIVREYLESKGIFYQYLDGSTSGKNRQKRLDAFQSGEGSVFLISLKAGGVGINLTAADYVIHLDPWWNPAVEDQASDRAHRLGQLNPVTIYRLVVSNSIEEKILGMHAEKRDLADSLLDGGDVAGKLDSEALLSLLRESY